MTTAIVCRQLKKRYDQRKKNPVDALVGLDLEVYPGECFGLLGPNGAGKTTTIEILEGLLKPTSGSVEVLEMRWGENDDAIRQRIGISLQETRLTDKLTVAETARLFRSFYRRGREPQEVLEAVSLTEKSDAWVEKLSGGQKQRLAVACALVGDPELLFLDEPTTGLDPQSRRDIWEIVRSHRLRGGTTLITTHYMDEAERLCDRVAVVDKGRVIALGTPPELIAGLGGEHVIEFALENGPSEPRASGRTEPEGPTCGPDPTILAQLASVRDCHLDNGTYALTVSQPHVCIPALLERLRADSCELARLTTRHASLEDVFVHLTGRHLIADEEADQRS
ncbi:MAG: ABC transporter ATP-binding protein [Planctomycetota bacterium]|jgi:ABC-2 type transport system ATP-binding protein